MGFYPFEFNYEGGGALSPCAVVAWLLQMVPLLGEGGQKPRVQPFVVNQFGCKTPHENAKWKTHSLIGDIPRRPYLVLKYCTLKGMATLKKKL